MSDPSDANICTPSAKGTFSHAPGSRASEKTDNSKEDDNDTHRRGIKQVIADFGMVEVYHQGFLHYHAAKIAPHMEQMSIGPDAGDYRPSDDEGEVYCQDFIHYHVREIARHIEQMAIVSDASDYGPSDDENQEPVRSNGKAMCNRAEGQNSDENYASKQHSEYSTPDECGRNERSIESCSSAAAQQQRERIYSVLQQRQQR